MKDKIVKEWFERAHHDYETAKLVFIQKGHYDEIMFLFHQAIEKYLKGYLIFHGWELKKIHDLETLFTEAMEFDKGFEKYLDFGRKLTAYYYENRYPPGPIPEILDEEVSDSVKIVDEVITEIKNKIKLKE